jgi:hypothetical protein
MSEPPKRCANCNTERYGIYCRGYCERCYRLTIQKEQVERWNVKDPSTLKDLPSLARAYSQQHFEHEFSKIKAKRLKEFEVRLRLRKIKEAQPTGEVTDRDIEHVFSAWRNGPAEKKTSYIGSPA